MDCYHQLRGEEGILWFAFRVGRLRRLLLLESSRKDIAAERIFKGRDCIWGPKARGLWEYLRDGGIGGG